MEPDSWTIILDTLDQFEDDLGKLNFAAACRTPDGISETIAEMRKKLDGIEQAINDK